MKALIEANTVAINKLMTEGVKLPLHKDSSEMAESLVDGILKIIKTQQILNS
jgi:hypothetical protein